MRITATMVVERARHPQDVVACRSLVQAVYGARYGVTFTDGPPDPGRKLEPWPDAWVLARIDGALAAAAGLYERATYVERFGGVTRAEIEAVAREARVPVDGRRIVEYTRLVVDPEWEGQGLGSKFLAITHSRGFLAPEGGQTPLVLACGKLSVFGAVYPRAGVWTRTIKPFPRYASHERYRSESDPMESRLIVPELDLDPILHSLQLPLSLDLAIAGDRRVA